MGFLFLLNGAVFINNDLQRFAELAFPLLSILSFCLFLSALMSSQVSALNFIVIRCHYRMLNSSTTDRDQQTADSLATFFHRRSSQCQSTRSQQYSLSKGEAAETESVEEYYFDKKQSECQFHKLDSFSTLSIGQSPYEVAAMERATYSYMQNIACQAGIDFRTFDVVY